MFNSMGQSIDSSISFSGDVYQFSGMGPPEDRSASCMPDG